MKMMLLTDEDAQALQNSMRDFRLGHDGHWVDEYAGVVSMKVNDLLVILNRNAVVPFITPSVELTPVVNVLRRMPVILTRDVTWYEKIHGAVPVVSGQILLLPADAVLAEAP